jgi:hypothetical protein
MLAGCNYLVIIIEQLDDLLCVYLLSLCKDNRTIVNFHNYMMSKTLFGVQL